MAFAPDTFDEDAFDTGEAVVHKSFLVDFKADSSIFGMGRLLSFLSLFYEYLGEKYASEAF